MNPLETVSLALGARITSLKRGVNEMLTKRTSMASHPKNSVMRPDMSISMLACSLLLWAAGLPELFAQTSLSQADAQAPKPFVVLDLWPGKAPDETAELGPERVRMSPGLTRKQVEVTQPTRMITDVSRPTITVCRPDADKNTGTAVLICPGGGYWDLYWQLEGEEVASWLNSLGVTGVILKYRVPRRSDEPKEQPARRPLQDAQRAISLLRSKAGTWDVNPERIGIIGFSAGGHLSIATATSFEKRAYEPIDAIDQVSCRPDFAILAYPGYLKAKDKDELAPGLHVPPGTPPVFLVHGAEDIISPPEHSLYMYLALKRAGVSAELHIYSDSAHDFGVRTNDHPCSAWTEACRNWLERQQFLKRSTGD
jgi:acetyl esterase/lipase